MRCLLRFALLAAVLFVIAASPAIAQGPPPGGAPVYNPKSAAVQQPPTNTQASSQPPAWAQYQSNVPIFNPAYPNAPNYGGGGWGGGYSAYTGNNANGYLNGAANMTVANAQYNLTTQQARIVQQQADREMIATRRAASDERDYERDKWWKENDPDITRQKDIDRALRRALNDPPKLEIWSAIALNPILIDLQKAEAAGVRGPSVIIEPDMLPHIVLTDGTTYDGAGVLKDLTKFNWPLPLRRMSFNEQRAKVEELTRKAIQQGRTEGIVTPELYDELDTAVFVMQGQLESQVGDLTPTQYVQGARYIKELRGSLKVLTNDNVKKYLGNAWVAKGDNVFDLIHNMTFQGLKFAPCVPGDETYYTVLHQLLVTYETRLHQYSAPR
jgi:hypothetical protein